MVVGSNPVAVTSPSDFVPASSKEFLDIQATIECGFTLKRVRDMIKTWEAELNKHYSVDEVAKNLYSMGGQNGLVPVTCSAEGNCLFNSMSILLLGNESLNTELHMKTVREFITNRH